MFRRLLNLQEVSEYLHLTTDQVERLVRSGEIPFERKGDRCMFRKGAIEAWASQRLLAMLGPALQDYHKKTTVKHHEISDRHAIITELIQPDYIQPRLVSKTGPSLVRDMVALAVATGRVNFEKELLEGVVAREKLGSTAMPGGFALLHTSHHDPYMFEDSLVVLGRTVQPLPFHAPHGGATDIFFLIGAQDNRLHLHVLARLCMMCQNTDLIFQLRERRAAADMWAALRDSEAAVVAGHR